MELTLVKMNDEKLEMIANEGDRAYRFVDHFGEGTNGLGQLDEVYSRTEGGSWEEASASSLNTTYAEAYGRLIEILQHTTLMAPMCMVQEVADDGWFSYSKFDVTRYTNGKLKVLARATPRTDLSYKACGVIYQSVRAECTLQTVDGSVTCQNGASLYLNDRTDFFWDTYKGSLSIEMTDINQPEILSIIGNLVAFGS